MPILKNVLKICGLLFFIACSITNSLENSSPSVIVTESIFLDTNPDHIKVFVMSDNIIPNLRGKIIDTLQTQGVNLTQDYSSANVVLKVKTHFHGKVYKKEIPVLLHGEISFSNIQNFEIKENPPQNLSEKTMIDKLVEDPSGMIIGFSIGAGLSNPITAAPLGMAIGAALNIGLTSVFEKKQILTILDIEVQERSQKPIWYNDKRLHKKDEYSIRKYDYSDQTNWKTYKTRIIVNGAVVDLHQRVAAIAL